jgi:hypothetical protein
MKRMSGLKLLDEREGGGGRPAQKGDRVTYNVKIFLNQGDEVPLSDIQTKQLPEDMGRVEGGVTFIDHTIVLGRRQAIAGVEHGLTGMRVGGYRKVCVSPHLAYRDQGIPDFVPADAVLIVAASSKGNPMMNFHVMRQAQHIYLSTVVLWAVAVVFHGSTASTQYSLALPAQIFTPILLASRYLYSWQVTSLCGFSSSLHCYSASLLS